MLDFMEIVTKTNKKTLEISPSFIVNPDSKDLMIRGGDFYAIWDEKGQIWRTNEGDAIRLIDEETKAYAKEHGYLSGSAVNVMLVKYADTGLIDKWHKYCQKQMRDCYAELDKKIIFKNHEIVRDDYASKSLPYPLEEGDISAYEEIVSTLYSPEERQKIEWSIGSVVSGDSKNIQKFFVYYGSSGTGKSTILNIIQMLFDGYWTVFDSKSLGQSSNTFAMEPFKGNPLIAIQHDGDLSKIEDNTRLNSIVSHETMTMNEKFKTTYNIRLNSMLFMGTNRPVKITDSKSGLLRRLVDINPTGNLIPNKRYTELMGRIKFELGGIAYHCLQVYQNNPHLYDDYIPVSMMDKSNDFYNFVMDSFDLFSEYPFVTLKTAWNAYKEYCDDANVPFPFSMRVFKDELKNYFEDYQDVYYDPVEQKRYRKVYIGFISDKFTKYEPVSAQPVKKDGLRFDCEESILDDILKSCKAQYATKNETPQKKWTEVTTKLADINTKELHYIKVPQNHIVIDFDLKNAEGEKSYKKNLEAANKWPPTYAELSKSGQGIHLHYIYDGDVTKLCRVYDDDIEIKVFTGNSSLRRKLTKCNDIPIRTINSGLPLKGEAKMVDFTAIQSEKTLRKLILRNMRKEIHPGTKPSMDFIYKILEDAYNSGLKYDISDMEPDLIAFAGNSTNHAGYCLAMISKLKLKSEIAPGSDNVDDEELIFYDIEVFPNLLLVNWKKRGKDHQVVRMINPKPDDIEELCRHKLVGFNCRRYDNHVMYARMMGYNNEQLYELSKRIIAGDRSAMFGAAYNLSYTDIYDFAAAGNKKSLKKLEIEMGIHHEELGLPWDEPVPEELWEKVAKYCDNDVIATEAAFDYLSADWTAREILAELAEMTVNDTTNSLTTKIIFGNDKKPQSQFCYRNLAEPVKRLPNDILEFLNKTCPDMMKQHHGEADSLLPYFPGYTFDAGKSIYCGEEVGEGGYVYAEPGMYGNVALLDVSSMHPHSAIAECLFGPKYTMRFVDIVEGRVAIKHAIWEMVATILDGKLEPYISLVTGGKMTAKQLANALKTAINSVYGLTCALFDNPFKDPRNRDNIVAKRGALFMVDLKHMVRSMGYTVAHIKTDSIKIPDATPEVISAVMTFGKKYGYTFEHEATYERMCLVNNAVYIAKYATVEQCEKLYGKEYVQSSGDICGDNKKHGGEWTATGAQFAVPYIFKTLFSHERIEFEDLCQTFAVVKGDLYLDLNEELPDVSFYERIQDLRKRDLDRISMKDANLLSEYADISDEDLEAEISKGHRYRFVGRVGQFCPIRDGRGGGTLYRAQDNKYYAAAGTKGYRWMESEMVRTLDKEADINKAYYDALVDEAIESISEFGDYEWFVSEDPYIPYKGTSEPFSNYMNVPEGYEKTGVEFDKIDDILKGE